MLTQKYTTNLTEQQYKSNFGRLEIISNFLRDKNKNGEITSEEYINKVFEAANNLKILVTTDPEMMSEANPRGLKIVRPDDIFGYKEKLGVYHKRIQEEKDTELNNPKQFITLGERNAPCEILKRQNVKDLMIDTVEYADRVRRETKYDLCETPNGVKVSSPTFGSWGALSERSERTTHKCNHEFGENSKKIGEFHTHPGKDSNAESFSMADLLSFDDDALNYNNSNCIVYRKIDKKGKETVKARCTTGVDAKRYLQNFNIYNRNDKNIELMNRMTDKFIRDPDSQNSFSCVANLSKVSKFEQNKVQPTKIKQEKQSQKLTIPNRSQQKIEKREMIKKSKIVPRENTGFDFGGGFQL